MMWMLLFLAMHPPQLSVQGAPGELIEIPLRVATTQEARLYSSGVLEIDHVLPATQKEIVVQARIRPQITSGLHKTHIYLLPKTKDAVVLGSASRVQVQVEEQEMRTTHTGVHFEKHLSPLAVIGICIVALIVLLLGTKTVSFQKLATKEDESTKSTNR